MFFDVNRVIDQLCEANHTAGILQQEKEALEAECEKQALEIKCMSEEVSDLKERLKDSEASSSLWFGKYLEFKNLYEKLANIETPKQILEELPEELK